MLVCTLPHADWPDAVSEQFCADALTSDRIRHAIGTALTAKTDHGASVHSCSIGSANTFEYSRNLQREMVGREFIDRIVIS